MMADKDDWASLNATFPQKLYALMHHSENYDLVAWLDHGMSFRILNTDRFSAEIIPKYFKHAKLTSFQRQLNLYGFRRITKGEDQGAYFHPKFQRERRDLMEEICRLPNKAALQVERANYPYYENSNSSLNLRSVRSSATYNNTSMATSTLATRIPNHKFSNSNSISNKGMTVVTRNSAAAALCLSNATLENGSDDSNDIGISGISSISSHVDNSSGHSSQVTQVTFDEVPDMPIPLPKKMSKLSMNIGFGRDLRQGWLKPPVKRRRDLNSTQGDIGTGIGHSYTNTSEYTPTKKMVHSNSIMPQDSERDSDVKTILSDSKSNQLGMHNLNTGLFSSGNSIFNVSSELHRVDSQTWDIPDLDDGLNFSELFA